MMSNRQGAKFTFAGAVLLVAVTVSEAAPACDTGLKEAVVVGIEDGDTLCLDRSIEGSTTARLAGIRLAKGIAADLSELANGAEVCLRLAATERDRYGRLMAYVYSNDGLWMQGELLRRGLARVEPSVDAPAFVPAMLAIERKARAADAGSWGTGAFRIRTPTNVASAAGSFQLVEGRIVDAARHRNQWYLNFGTDWRSDFTVVIPKQALAAFADAGVEPYALNGRTIRVRGWVDLWNGPMIEVQVPEQIEVIDDTPKDSK